MGKGQLSVAFLWHMHQPYYKDLVSGRYVMPWVRLHGIKDYYDMANILREFPGVRQTFNLVPSLIDQILDYCDGGATGPYIEMTLKPAAELDKTDKVFVLRNFFLANWDNMIKPYPRYWDLLSKRGPSVQEKELERISRYFSMQDFLDLQVWFNLTWFDPLFKEGDPLIKGLIEKGRDYTEQEKELLVEKQREVMGLILPEYAELWTKGQIEVSVSPYYHPILPLLCDTETARVASPDRTLPVRFIHPEDAREQVRRAVERCEKVLGKRPVGMWPSEGSVSEDIIPILAGEGIRWIATDEQILANSLGVPLDRDYAGLPKKPEVLYRHYRAEKDGSGLDMVFRDHTLSDLIGFTYSKWDPKNAVEDFMSRLGKIRKELAARGANGIVSIMLDGENAWEHYRNDGRDFLKRLYDRLSSEPEFATVTVGEYTGSDAKPAELPKLFPGSWINHNFDIWIGHEEDNAAWDALSAARDTLVSYEETGVKDEQRLRLAWEEIYIAEGSDWCWWYGDDHSSENDREFDELFRKHITNVYTLIDKTPPDSLMIPIIREERKTRPTVELTAFISPTLDGEVTSYFEWLAAAYYDVSHYGGTMHRAMSVLTHIYYGFDLGNLFVRMDASLDLTQQEHVEGLTFSVHFLRPGAYRVEVEINPVKGEITAVMLGCGTDGAAQSCQKLSSIAAHDIIEMAIPFELIGARPKDEVNFFVTIRRGDIELEKWPYRGYLSFTVPTEDFESIMWHV